MRLFAFVATIVLIAAPVAAGDKAVQALDANPYGLVGDCESVAGSAVQTARDARVSLGEAWRALDPQGACFGPLAEPSGIAGMPEPLGFGPSIVVDGFGPHTTPTGFGPVYDPSGFGPVVTPSGFGPVVTPSGDD